MTAGGVMLGLARLLLRDRGRKLAMDHGWVRYASIVLLFALLACALSTAAAARVKIVTTRQLQSVLTTLWALWVSLGVLSGRDLGWTVRVERILPFSAQGFLRLYSTAFCLGFASFPLVGALSVLVFFALIRSGPAAVPLSAAIVGIVIYIASVRLVVSFVRAAVVRGRYLTVTHKVNAAAVCAGLSFYTIVSILHPGIGWCQPGYHLGSVLGGAALWLHLACLAATTAVLAVLDYSMQRSLIYSGIQGPLAPSSRMLSGGNLILFHPEWPGPLFRVSMLCWLRSRSALLLLIWGAGYGFFYMYFTKPDAALHYFLLIWMQQLFYGYLRGNLLGTDRQGLWFYCMIAMGLERMLNAKNQSLSFLQGCMVTGVLAGGFLSHGHGMPLSEWARVLSYAISSMLCGEICGFFFSIRYPDPIDRTSQYSGGTSPGALLVPLIQAAYLIFFALVTGLARRFLLPAAYWSLLLSVPAAFILMRFSVLPCVRAALSSQWESIVKKLSAFPT